MKDLFCLLLLFIFSFNLPKQVIAVYSSYSHYTNNGVLNPGPSTWDSYRIQYPNILYENGVYKMWYSGHNGSYWSVGYAISLDGINWYKYPLNPVLEWDSDENHPKHIITPSVINDNGTYRMWFTSSYTDHNDYDFTIGYATSQDGLQWTIQTYEQLKPSQFWDLVGLTHPFILKKNSQEYYMYYSARRTQNWNIGYAFSTDGNTWIPYINNPIITTTGKWWEKGSNLGPHVIYNNSSNLYQMWYSTESLGQSASSMAYAESTNNTLWTKPETINPVLNRELTGFFDDLIISDGSVSINGNSIYLWYGGKANDSKWRIGLSYFGDVPTPLPTPIEPFFPTVTPTSSPSPTQTPTPTPIPATPTPIHTPTPTPLKPIVIIPGMFASWNKEEILENKHTNSSWKLLNFVKEYDGLIQTLKNLGYVENSNLFIWLYDWRQPITDLSTQLDTYLSDKIFSIPEVDTINIVGHSLGGLVARAWTQSGNNRDKINSLITLGSPHQGVIQPYLAWEGGDISYGNSILSFTTQLLLQINKKRFQSNKETIQQVFPVLKDLLPPSSYLIRKSDNSEITKNQMLVWNNWLETLNSTVGSIYPMFDAIVGNSNNTPHKYIVTQPNKIDSLLGNWQDGKPIQTIDELGDGTVTQLRSGFIDDPNNVLNKNHGELIASKEGITKILDILNLDYTSNAIIEGKSTTFAPGLLFLLESPATIFVKHNDIEYRDTDGILFIPDAPEGIYTTTITGIGNGEYHLSIGQFSDNNTVWSSITKPIQLNDQHTYVISYQPQNPRNLPITNMTIEDWLAQIDNNLTKLNTYVNKETVKRLRMEVALIQKMLSKQQYFVVKVQIELLLRSLSKIRHTSSIETIRVVDDIERILSRLYVSLFQDKPSYFPEKSLYTQKAMLDKELSRVIKMIDSGTTFSSQELLFIQRGIEIFELGKTNLLKNQLAEATFQFILAHYLFQIH